MRLRTHNEAKLPRAVNTMIAMVSSISLRFTYPPSDRDCRLAVGELEVFADIIDVDFCAENGDESDCF